MTSSQSPQWRLPAGVTRGLWDYIHSAAIAEDYDQYFAENRLFEFDEQVLLRHVQMRGLGPGAVAVDLGCGTGRALIALARRGLRGVAVDLSPRMLSIVRQKASRERCDVVCLQANMVELDGLADDAADVVVSLFSTLGMIRGRAHRQRALDHARRILRPGGLLVLHVHNYWYNLRDPTGPWWLLRNLLRSSLVGDVEAGDKFFDYRGVPNMFLHVFSRRELRRSLAAAGFRVLEMIPLDPRRHRALRCAWLLGRLRANGWIVVCE